MSTATVTKVVGPKQKKFEVIATTLVGPQPVQLNAFVTVFVATLVAFFLSTAAIGSVVFWIAMRHSGMLPFDSFGR